MPHIFPRCNDILRCPNNNINTKKLSMSHLNNYDETVMRNKNRYLRKLDNDPIVARSTIGVRLHVKRYVSRGIIGLDNSKL